MLKFCQHIKYSQQPVINSSILRVSFIIVLFLVSTSFSSSTEVSATNKQARYDNPHTYIHLDPFFRTCYCTLQEKIKNQDNFLKNYTYVLVKPDGLLGENLRKIMKVLSEEGYILKNMTKVVFSNYTTKLLWMYSSKDFP